jgi:prepilin-type N-terminal cleavage/methylation domain-containing protein
MRNRGLTLIEVMIVCAIIAVVSAIAFPVYQRAKATADKTTCLSNIRQVNTALLMYREEHRYPPMGSTPSWLTPLGLERGNKALVKCPLFRTRFVDFRQNDMGSGYTWNACLNMTLFIDVPADPSRTVAVTETGSFVRLTGDLNCEEEHGELQGPDSLIFTPDVIKRGRYHIYSPHGSTRHFGGANYGMLDGRAVWRKPSQVRFYDTSIMKDPKPYDNWPCLMRPGGRWVGPEDGITFQIIP